MIDGRNDGETTWRQRAAALAERFGFVLIPALFGWFGGVLTTVIVGYFFWRTQC